MPTSYWLTCNKNTTKGVSSWTNANLFAIFSLCHRNAIVDTLSLDSDNVIKCSCIFSQVGSFFVMCHVIFQCWRMDSHERSLNVGFVHSVNTL